jgi:hypothetical protein
MMKDNWIPVYEKKPSDYRTVLVSKDYGDSDQHVDIAWWNDTYWANPATGNPIPGAFRVNAWMLFPAGFKKVVYKKPEVGDEVDTEKGLGIVVKIVEYTEGSAYHVLMETGDSKALAPREYIKPTGRKAKDVLEGFHQLRVRLECEMGMKEVSE